MTNTPLQPSDYELRALDGIDAWRNPPASWYRSMRGQLDRAWDSATDWAKKVPGVEWAIENIVTGLLELTNEISQDSVWRDGVLRDFVRAGSTVRSLEEIRALDLSVVDRALDGLELKYQSLAGVEGAASGLAGAVGIVPDIVALVAINLRAAGEYATYCGFDVTSREERLYALQILDLVAGPGDHPKHIAFEPAVRMAKRVAQKQGIQAVEQVGFNEAVERLARAIGIHLTGRKLGQVVPVAGAAVGAGLNVLYTGKVCRAAFHLYRERFLVGKYGLEPAI